MKLALLVFLWAAMANAAGFRLDSSSSNIPASPSTAAGSLVLTGIGNSKHLKICSEATTRIRYKYSHRSATVAPSAATDYDDVLPAAATGSFVCEIKDDVLLGTVLYIWSDSGSAISSGLVYGGTW